MTRGKIKRSQEGREPAVLIMSAYITKTETKKNLILYLCEINDENFRPGRRGV